MGDFTLVRSLVFKDEKGHLFKWVLEYSAQNFNTPLPAVPYPFVSDLQAFLAHYNTLILESIRLTADASLAGLTAMPTVELAIVKGGFNLEVSLEKQVFGFAVDTCEWVDLELPIATSEQGVANTLMFVAMANYVATDDLSLLLIGRFE